MLKTSALNNLILSPNLDDTFPGIFITVQNCERRSIDAQRPRSGALEAMAAFAAAKVGSGSNVTCNVLLAVTSLVLGFPDLMLFLEVFSLFLSILFRVNVDRQAVT